MKSFSFRRILAAVLLLVVLGGVAVVWLVGSEYGRHLVAQKVRRALTHDSELVLEPFEVEFSPWSDFPHLTASIQHIALTDTSFRRRMPVLSLRRADLRLEMLPLLRGQVLVKRLALTDVDFRERVDSLGRSWGLRGKRKRGTGRAPVLNLKLDELLVSNFNFSSHNGYLRTAFGAHADAARLSVRLKGGVMQVAGTLNGQLSYLRTRAGTLFEHEPVQAWVHYQYTFRNRQGLLYRTRATLNGDTIRVSGTHTVAPDQPAGTLLNLRFVGNQPLTDVLHAALPPRLEPYLEGATSPSKAHIHYAITGLSGPKVTPHNVLSFSLRAASLKWPGQGRHITRWDLAGTYDNGPRHNIRSTVLTLKRCRIYSAAGRLDAALTLRDFKRPFVDGRLRGRAELAELAAVVSPGRWRARGGVADLDVRVRGLLPPPPNRPDLGPRKNLALNGTVNLHQASFLLPLRGADLSELDVKVGLQDSLWRLSNAAGVLNGMHFRASATTVHLLDYLTGQHPTARISGNFAVDELRVASLRHLLRPLPREAGPGFSPTSLPKRARNARDKAQLATTLGSELIPPGLLLNTSLRCQRLLLAHDTLENLAVTVRHDGRQVQLLNLAGRVWGGDVRGSVHWPTDPDNRVAPVAYDLGVHFASLNYRQFVERFTRPTPGAARPAKPGAKERPAGEPAPALRDLLLAANGRLTLSIDRAQLPEDESMGQVKLQLLKTGSLLRLPYLRFRTPEGGFGEAQATAEVENFRLTAADADLTLRYATLDVTRLLGLISSLTTPTDTVPTARSLARIERKATRRVQRQQAGGNHSLLSNGLLSAVLRVEADEVHYGPLRGSRFRLVSHLLEGEAKLDNCSVDVLQGSVRLSGSMHSTANRAHHPTQLQMRLQDVELPALFAGASGMGLNVLGSDNIRGSLRGVADIRTDLGPKYLPNFMKTDGYLKVDFRNLELINVDALMEALKFMKAERTGHLYFEPVTGEFLLTQGQLIIPGLRLDSNLSNLEISGHYGLEGATNLFIGLKPFQALFGNNEKRIERIQRGEQVSHSDNGKLTYVNLRRTAPKEKYKVRLFQRDEQREAMARLRQQYRDYLTTQRLDTTVRLLR
ncbi:AsmA-like C-terminal region-containing protein [Hymenobacter monticola]|uniref:AsmA-like C-terminal region-containing protein n=1 Tax=Hymenobacter monticola TaxID=1705399 RepID=A0ABY4AZU2_9BACT|nr:AsmA-like C-terminal region-containing protein [Hymenobacter monticola]UOE32422.1 AsmA-like C-terminal region-containing protein [Hymenobacter monticola]